MPDSPGVCVAVNGYQGPGAVVSSFFLFTFMSRLGGYDFLLTGSLRSRLPHFAHHLARNF